MEIGVERGKVARRLGRSELVVNVRFPDANQVFLDTLTVEHLGSKLWRLEENAAWSDYAAWHDIVEADMVDGELVVRRVFQKSGCRKIKLFVPAGFSHSQQGTALCQRVLQAGGMWEVYAEGYLMMNVPEGSGEDWERLLDEAIEAFEGGR